MHDSAAGTSQHSVVTSTTPSHVKTAHAILGNICVFLEHVFHLSKLILCSLDLDDLFTVYSELFQVAYRWKGIGLALRLGPNLLERIRHKSYDDVENYLRDVLTEWLKRHIILLVSGIHRGSCWWRQWLTQLGAMTVL